jgi:hypothetical protein
MLRTNLAHGLTPKPLLGQNHIQCRYENDETVPNVAEHDSKQEWERHNCEQAWVNLLIGSNAIVVHDSLKSFCKLVGPMISRRRFMRAQFM